MRKMHLWGSLPDATPAIPWVTRRFNPGELTTMPVDLERMWIIDYLRSLADRDAFRLVRDGDFTGYTDFRVYRPARTLTSEDVGLRRAAAIETALADYGALNGDVGSWGGDNPPLAICRAHPIDLALFTFVGGPDWRHPARTAHGLRLALKYQNAYELDFLAEQQRVALQARHADVDAIVQLEEPHVLYALLQAPPALRPPLARWLARRTADILPGGAILHLCYGRLEGEQAVTPDDLSAAVLYLNALQRECERLGIASPRAVGIPCAYGSEPAPVDPRFYAPLSGLAIDSRIIAGVVDAGDAERSVRAVQAFERAWGATVHAVALPCGMGHLGADQADTAVVHMVMAAHADEVRGSGL